MSPGQVEAIHSSRAFHINGEVFLQAPEYYTLWRSTNRNNRYILLVRICTTDKLRVDGSLDLSTLVIAVFHTDPNPTSQRPGHLLETSILPIGINSLGGYITITL